MPMPAKNRPASMVSLFWHAVWSTPPRMKMTPATTTGRAVSTGQAMPKITEDRRPKLTGCPSAESVGDQRGRDGGDKGTVHW